MTAAVMKVCESVHTKSKKCAHKNIKKCAYFFAYKNALEKQAGKRLKRADYQQRMLGNVRVWMLRNDRLNTRKYSDKNNVLCLRKPKILKRSKNMVKIKVSYDNEKEFSRLIKYLLPITKSLKKPKDNGSSPHKRAYIDTNIDIK